MDHRSFTTRQDMMDLYQRMVEVGQWEEFDQYATDELAGIYVDQEYLEPHDFTAWFFCLSGEGYEERCKMVAEFIGGEK